VYPGNLSALLAKVRDKFRESALTELLGDVGQAVDANSFDKLTKIPGVNPSRLVAGGAASLERFRETNALLIRSIPEKMARDVGTVLGDVDVAGLHVTDVSKILADRFSVAASRAEFWARDQTLKLYANVQESRQRAAGAAKYQWEHSGDERVRGRPDGLWPHGGDHWVLGDTIQLWSTPPIVDPRTGRREHPGRDYQCRCSAYPIFEGDPIEVPPPEFDTTAEQDVDFLANLP
jgi:uncharacterized protein with gpF-like domain